MPLKIITMLQDSRFDNRKKENKCTQKYIFIYLYSFEGIWPVGQETYDTELRHFKGTKK